MKVAVFGKRRQSREDAPLIFDLINSLSEHNVFITAERLFFEAMTGLRAMVFR